MSKKKNTSVIIVVIVIIASVLLVVIKPFKKDSTTDLPDDIIIDDFDSMYINTTEFTSNLSSPVEMANLIKSNNVPFSKDYFRKNIGIIRFY